MADCSRTTAKGAPCRNAAVHGSDPPACSVHLGTAGRKTALNGETTALLVAALRAGNHTSVAIAALGIAKRTFYEWMERGDPDGTDPDDDQFRRFRADVDAARAYGEITNITTIAQAATKDWRAAAWIEERLSPERWGKGRRAAEDDAEPSVSAAAPAGGDPFADDPADELSARRVATGRS